MSDYLPPLPWKPPVTVQAMSEDGSAAGEPARFGPATAGKAQARITDIPADTLVSYLAVADSEGARIFEVVLGRVVREGDVVTAEATVDDNGQIVIGAA